MSRAARTLAVSTLGAAAVALTVPAASATPARPIAAGAAISRAAASADGPSASVSPATVRRGRSVTVAVTCAVRDEVRMPRNISGEGRVLRDGTITLERQGNTGTYRGAAQTAPRVPLGLGPIDEAAAARADARAAWAIEGVCPDSAPWSVTVRTTVADPAPAHTPSGAPSGAPHTTPSGPPAGNAPAPGTPRRELLRPEGRNTKQPGPNGPASGGPDAARPGASRPGAPHGPVAAGGGGAERRPATEVRFAELARITAGDRSAATLLAAGGAVLAATAAGGYLLARRRERGAAGRPDGGAARP
ncbi:hypothetical protein [Streptomyces sp. NPDC014733]|uniref:hypothetical protein n=1 Tax=Streptomyces sp. NPDC014733 TaxID=3364885 RepID=UPI0036FF168D